MSEEHCCEYCGAKDAYLVIYKFGYETHEIYLCFECDSKELEDLNDDSESFTPSALLS